MSDNDDARWITSKGGNVVADPFYSSAMIEKREVRILVRGTRKAKNSKTVATNY
jgi:hypothetical protein